MAGRERPHGQRPADGRDTGTTLGYVTVLLLLAAICVLLATRADPSYILLPGVGIAFALVFLLAHTQQQKLVAARRAYRASLDRLRAAPNDAALRQEALKLGRRYAARVRGEPGGRVFDEAAIKNDIDATCAGAVHVTGRSVEERLAKLKNLLDAQHITEDEYRQKRQAILDEL